MMEEKFNDRQKSRDELVEELMELKAQHRHLNDLFKAEINNEKNVNAAFLRLNQYAIKLSMLKPDACVEQFISEQLIEFTQGVAAIFSAYDAHRMVLIPKHIEVEQKLIDKIVKLLGKQFYKIYAGVTKDTYQMMTQNIIGEFQSLSEATFGAIPEMTGVVLKKLIGADRFIGIAYLIEGKLYGTSLVGLSGNKPKLTFEMLEYFAYITAVTLRRKLAEDLLRESEEKYKVITQSSMDIIFIMDQEGRQLFFNKSVEKILGYTSEQVLSNSFRKFVPQDQLLKCEQAIKNVFDHQELTNFVTQIYHKAGHLVDVEINARIIKLKGEYVVLGTIRDVTEKRVFEEKLRQKNEELVRANIDKDRFISVLGHDLISPFNAILGLLELLSRNLRTYDLNKIEKLLLNINQSAQSTYHLLEDLLLWTRSQASALPFNPQAFNLYELCVEVTDSLKLLANNKNIKIISRINKKMNLCADKDMIKIVLRNLISNAIKFSFPSGQVFIHAQLIDHKVIVSIRDKGIGISTDKQHDLFEKAMACSTKGTANESGTGLGLSLCKEFIDKHSGKIWVESIKDKGSTFYFSLPV